MYREQQAFEAFEDACSELHPGLAEQLTKDILAEQLTNDTLTGEKNNRIRVDKAVLNAYNKYCYVIDDIRCVHGRLQSVYQRAQKSP